jgi:cell division protein FtsZ
MAVLDDLKYEMQDEGRPAGGIKVIGVGGGGMNAVAHMMRAGMQGVEFYAINTDTQALNASPIANKITIGSKLTHGRGTGGDPETGKQAALDDTEHIVEALEGADLVFIAAGLGCGTGTGAAPVVASLAKEMNALTVAVVTKPFAFEGARRIEQAERGLAELATAVDTVITIPNDRLLALAPRGTSILEGFRLGYEFICRTVEDIVEIMTTPGIINRDFADVRSVMAGMGHAMLGTATATGENAAVEAAKQAIASPLLAETSIRGARNVLMNVTGSSKLGLHEVHEACELVRKAAGCDDVQLNFGVVLKEEMGDSAKVTVIATGFPSRSAPPAPPPVFANEEPAPVAPSGAWLSEMQPEPPAAEAAPPEPEPEPEPEDLDDLDTPAYLRRRRLQ